MSNNLTPGAHVVDVRTGDFATVVLIDYNDDPGADGYGIVVEYDDEPGIPVSTGSDYFRTAA